MTSRRGMMIGIVCAVLASASLAHTQTPAPKPDPVLRDVLLEQWTDIGQKIIKMAEELPADKYDFRPTPDVRTFADVFRHVAFWNLYVQKTARGEKIDARQNELPKAEYPTKDKIVDALKKTFADATAELKKAPATPSAKFAGLWVTFTEHSGEHYGQLVVYYRLNKIVPPASRPGA
jgi:DinB family protein